MPLSLQRFDQSTQEKPNLLPRLKFSAPRVDITRVLTQSYSWRFKSTEKHRGYVYAVKMYSITIIGKDVHLKRAI